MKIKDINHARDIFETAANKHVESTENGDYKSANKNYGLIVKAIDYLKMNNKLSILKVYLNNPNLGLKMWAAAYLLQLYETESLNVLESIANSNGIHSLTAKTTISEWKLGKLKL